MNELWSWVLTGVGLAGFFLAGKKVWWCWYVNIANQILWFTYAWITEQWGFLVGVFAYLFVFSKNAYHWTKERFEPDPHSWNTIGYVTTVTEDENGVIIEGLLNKNVGKEDNA